MIQEWIDKTMAYLEYSYAPYSKFNVASCVVCKDAFYYGVNIENASFSLTNCAERSALFNAYSNGVKSEDIQALIVVSKQDTLIYPCGACRQVMLELLDLECTLIVSNGVEYDCIKVKELLPKAFKKEQVK